MSDDEADSSNKTKPSKKQRRRYVRKRAAAQPDYLLGMFTGMAETSGVEYGVTLTVGGAVVTGVMVGRREWLRRLVGAEESLEFLSAVQQAWDEQAAEEAEAGVEHEDDLDYLEPFETMIHLVDARYMLGQGGGIPTGQGMFWRGLLAEVDGWSFGTFS